MGNLSCCANEDIEEKSNKSVLSGLSMINKMINDDYNVKNRNLLVKILLLGDKNIGKSCLI